MLQESNLVQLEQIDEACYAFEEAWQAEDLPLKAFEDISPSPLESVTIDQPYQISREALQSRLGSSDLLIWDTRSQSEYLSGHIPGAVHLEWTNFLDAQGRIGSSEHCAAQLKKLQIPGSACVVPYCQTHRRSSFAFMVLMAADLHAHVRCYDGSWSEWSNAPAMPINSGPRP